MRYAPLLAMGMAFIAALIAWSLGMHEAAVLVGALGLMLGVVGIILTQATE